MLNQFEGSKKVRIESFLRLFTLLKTAHDMNHFSYSRSCRVQGLLVSDIELSHSLVSQNEEFLQQQLVSFQHTCGFCVGNFSDTINITNPCCHTRICFPCYIDCLQSTLEPPTIIDPNSETKLLAYCSFIVAQEIKCHLCHQHLNCVYLTNLSANKSFELGMNNHIEKGTRDKPEHKLQIHFCKEHI